MFKDYEKRLSRDIQRLVTQRSKLSFGLGDGDIQPKPIEVQVVSHSAQRYAVWSGGSLLASTPEFYQVCHRKAEYEEYGPSMYILKIKFPNHCVFNHNNLICPLLSGICRHNPVFGAMT